MGRTEDRRKDPCNFRKVRLSQSAFTTLAVLLVAVAFLFTVFGRPETKLFYLIVFTCFFNGVTQDDSAVFYYGAIMCEGKDRLGILHYQEDGNAARMVDPPNDLHIFVDQGSKVNPMEGSSIRIRLGRVIRQRPKICLFDKILYFSFREEYTGRERHGQGER